MFVFISNENTNNICYEIDVLFYSWISLEHLTQTVILVGMVYNWLKNQYDWRHNISNAWQYFTFWISELQLYDTAVTTAAIATNTTIQYWLFQRHTIQRLIERSMNCFEPKISKIVFQEMITTTNDNNFNAHIK